MPKISITTAVTILSGVLIIVVAAVTLSISYLVVFDSVRDIGRITAASLSENSFAPIAEYLERPIEAAASLQAMMRTRNWTVPANDPDPNWRQKWVELCDSVQINNYRRFNTNGIFLTDNNHFRSYTVGNTSAVVTTDVKNPANGTEYTAHVDQYDRYTYEKLTDETPFAGIHHDPRFWEDSIQERRAITNNFTKLTPFYFNTQYMIVTPAGPIVSTVVTGTLHNSGGELMGMLSTVDSISTLDDLLVSASYTENTQVFALRHTGSIVATTHEFKSPNRTLLPPTFNFSLPKHPDCEYPQGSLPPEHWWMTCQVAASEHPYTPLNEFVASLEFKREEESGSTEQFLHTLELEDKAYFVAGRRLVFDGANFTIVLLMPESDLLSDIVRARNTSIYATVGIFVACTIMFYVVLSVVFSPLKQVEENMVSAANFAQKSGDGDDAGRGKAVPSVFAEISNIQTAYHRMIEELGRIRSYVPQSLLRTLNAGGEEDDDEGDVNSSVVASTSSGSNVRTKSSAKSGSATSGTRSSVSHLGTAARRLGTGLSLTRRHVTVVTVALSDLYSSLKQQSPSETIAAHADTLKLVYDVAVKQRGVFDLFSGDSFTITFNAVTNCASHITRAAATVLQVQGSAKASKNIQCGVACGEVHCGNMGNEDVRRFNIVGYPAARSAVLQRMCSALSVQNLVSHACYQTMHFEYVMQCLDVVRLPGSKMEGAVATIIARKQSSEADSEWMYALEDAEAQSSFTEVNGAYMKYLSGDTEGARAVLQQIPAGDPSVGVSHLRGMTLMPKEEWVRSNRDKYFNAMVLGVA